MAKHNQKICKLDLHTIQQSFPAEKPVCTQCTYCPLLRAEKHTLHCGFLPGAPGKYVNPRVRTKAKRRIALLKVDCEVNGTQVGAGQEVLLDRQQNAGTYLWVRARNPGLGRLGKFLVNKNHLDLDGPLVQAAHGERVEKITALAVLIAGIWWPRCEIRKPAELQEGDQIEYLEVPEWLAQLKGLL